MMTREEVLKHERTELARAARRVYFELGKTKSGRLEQMLDDIE